MKRSRKLLSILLALALCASLFPAAGLASENAGNFPGSDALTAADAAASLRGGDRVGAVRILRQVVGLSEEPWENEPYYAITALTVSDGAAEATVVTGGACTLRVQILDDAGEQVLWETSAPADAGLSGAPAAVVLDGAFFLPAYFVARAMLVDDSETLLCAPFTTLQYTSAYDRFLSQTPENYPDNIVLDYGSTGFGVLTEDVIELPGTAVLEDSGAFTVSAPETPRPGDIVLLTLSDGTRTPIKVKTVADNGDGTVTVLPDEDVSLSEMYEVFRLDVDVDVGAAAQNNGQAPALDGKAVSADLVKLSGNIRLADALTVGYTSTIKGHISVSYDKKLFGEDYIEKEIDIETKTELSVTVSGKINTNDLEDEFGNSKAPEILLYEGPFAVVGPGLIIARTRVTIPFEFSFEASGTASVSMTSRQGVRFTTIDGMQQIDERSDPSYSFRIAGKFECKAGPKVEMKVTAVYALSASVSAQAGFKVKAELAASEANTTAASMHACRECLDISVSGFISLEGSLKYSLGVVKGTIASLRLLPAEWRIIGAFFSVSNEPESEFRGVPTFGTGQCPNKKYRVTVKTEDAEGNPVTGVPVTVSDDRGLGGSGPSPYTLYLYDGIYSAEAAFDAGDAQAALPISGGAFTVTLQEPEPEPTPTPEPPPTPEPTPAATPESTPGPADALKNAQPGDTVTYGRYEQDNDPADGSEPIEWLVLDRTGSRLLVISRYGLDAVAYHNDKDTSGTTWEACSLRAWLNTDFLNAAFSPAEQAMIPAVTVTADPNPDHATDQGSDTVDRVFLLSAAEAEAYLPAAESRRCLPTAYALGKNAFTVKNYGWWRLRTSGAEPVFAAYVDNSGTIRTYGNGINVSSDVVRPAMWIETGA